jgi:hypothetical protein
VSALGHVKQYAFRRSGNRKGEVNNCGVREVSGDVGFSRGKKL